MDLEEIVYIENDLSYETYYHLRESVNWTCFEEKQIREALQHTYYSVVAMRKQEIIGMVRLLGDGLYFVIADVVVKPEYQGKGIGNALLKKVLIYIEETTPTGGRVSVQLIAEPGKEAFYERLGFKRIPHEFCGSGMRKVIHKE